MRRSFSVVANNNVIQQSYTDYDTRIPHLFGECVIGSAGDGVSRGVVVHEDDGTRAQVDGQRIKYCFKICRMFANLQTCHYICVAI